MKGHMENGKFHPHTEHKGVRKQRDQQAKTQGVNVSKLKFAEKGSGKGFDGLGRKEPVKIARVGEIGKVSFGSGIDSGKIGKVVGIKKANEIPVSSSDWFQIKVIKPDIQKGIIIQVPKGRVEAVTGQRKARDVKIGDVKLDDGQKSILRYWVEQNKDWTTIDDLPNEIFTPLVSPAGDDIDKRVAIQMEAIDYMKKVTEGIKHIQLIKNELNDNLIKMKISPDNLNITKERTNLQKQLKQLRKKYNYYGDQS